MEGSLNQSKKAQIEQEKPGSLQPSKVLALFSRWVLSFPLLHVQRA